MNGRKRHLAVDTLGLLLVVVVHAASLQDRVAARLVLAGLAGRFARLRLIWADGAYLGPPVALAAALGWVLQIVRRTDDRPGFRPLPRRWVVERTFAWLGRYRRLSKDYEELPASSEAMIRLAMTHLMLRRLSPG